MSGKGTKNNKDKNGNGAPICLSALNCFFVNARGLLSKIDVLRDCAVQMKLDIIGVAETFLNSEVLQAEIYIDGYKIYRKDRCNVKAGKCGGVILYIRDDIISYECDDLNGFNCESVWGKIKTERNDELTVGVCYKSQAAEERELDEMFEAIKGASKGRILLMGDFNYPSINWETLECDSAGSKFMDLVLDNYLCQHVKVPTRDRNVLDLVITSDVNMVENLRVLEHLGGSDHNIITWQLICNVGIGKSKQPVRQYHKADYVGMKKWFEEIDWIKEFIDYGLDGTWDKFCSIINLAVNKFVPMGHNKA